ncbi:MAG: N-(5'-phosphoribosyl)anthranilate isomerase, partial [Novosphingobium sp.]|nr:N-(5'-phosphoribosyl)anthranilate isomerase [Novosphingobium sp.]
MPVPRIKICGVNSSLALDATIAARADFCGLNFYPPSPRFASLALARDLAARAAGRIALVGVFVD